VARTWLNSRIVVARVNDNDSHLSVNRCGKHGDHIQKCGLEAAAAGSRRRRERRRFGASADGGEHDGQSDSFVVELPVVE
jgi:ribosomal protein L37E